MTVHIGCAGWSIPRHHIDQFPVNGTHLNRYAQRLNAVEINTSFYRPHQPKTYARWAASVPENFRFGVKVPREITHECCLVETEQHLERFLDEVRELGEKLGPLLVQLPPSFELDDPCARQFFSVLRERFAGAVVCEPRHPTWFTLEAASLLERFQVARVAADPARVPAAAQPGGWSGLTYYRLHGSPRTYYSEYSAEYLTSLADQLSQRAISGPVWCIFDNTALGHAWRDAMDLSQRLNL
jgi:uncharacterized protein YecE (DUF72 family)